MLGPAPPLISTAAGTVLCALPRASCPTGGSLPASHPSSWCLFVVGVTVTILPVSLSPLMSLVNSLLESPAGSPGLCWSSLHDLDPESPRVGSRHSLTVPP